ncbi:MAG: hypothetical protein RR060_06470, partial [Victivallaceae bacterium]
MKIILMILNIFLALAVVYNVCERMRGVNGGQAEEFGLVTRDANKKTVSRKGKILPDILTPGRNDSPAEQLDLIVKN